VRTTLPLDWPPGGRQRSGHSDVGYAQASLRASGADRADGIRVSAEMLAERFADTGPTLTVAERAESDRTWAFGHVVVDEAQELSPMMWRLLMRRCPTRSMTLVGDVAQVGSAAGTSSWGAALDPYVHDRWRLEALTVNYRTPAAIMRIASDVLTGAGVTAPMPQSVREGDSPPPSTPSRSGWTRATRQRWTPYARSLPRRSPRSVAADSWWWRPRMWRPRCART
jgi:hypothetical protein